MPLPRLIPCLDVAGGRVVKGVRFEGLRDVGDPSSSARPTPTRVRTSSSSSTSLRPSSLARPRFRCGARRRAGHIPFTFGGGIRSVADAYAVLEAGADKVSVNSAALARPELIEELAASLGSQAVVVAIDTEDGRVSRMPRRGTPRATRSRGRKSAKQRGAGELLVTSIDRDGTRGGTTSSCSSACATPSSLPVIASGGAGNAEHSRLRSRRRCGTPRFDPARATARLESLRRELRDLGVPLRDAA